MTVDFQGNRAAYGRTESKWQGMELQERANSHSANIGAGYKF